MRSEKARNLLKSLYDLSVSNDRNDEQGYMRDVLPELILEDMDEEQIWQQIEIRNNSIWPKFLEKISKLLAIKEDNFSLVCVSQEEDSLKVDEGHINGGDMSSDFSESDEDTREVSKVQNKKKDKNTKKAKASIVDDKFFKLSEMEEFLNQEDRREELRQKGKLDEEEDSIDYFENLSDEDEENAKYLEFFDEEEEELSPESLEKNRRKNLKKRRSSEDSVESELGSESSGDEKEQPYQKHRKNSENSLNDSSTRSSEDEIGGLEDDENSEIDDEGDKIGKNFEENIDDEDNNDNDQSENKSDDDDDDNHIDPNPSTEKSSFEQRQDRLRKKIEEHEENILQEKPWQLKGEITATGRPPNSLLEEILEFDAATRPAPVITEETTLRLEDIIKQRIKDKAWDDVERKYKPIQTPQEFRKKLVLDQEKSKESLAQIYEKEYQAQLEKLNPSRSNDKEEEEPKQHKEIRELMKSLFTKLDALSNFHYTPKPVAPEPKIITNTPAVNMEEVAPVAVSDANLLAPEEIKNRPKGDVLGKSERSKTDKKRERRKKKLHQKALYKRQEEKEAERQKLGLKPSKKVEKDKNLKNVIKNRNVQKLNTNPESVKSSKSFFSLLQDKTTQPNFKRSASDKFKKEEITAKKFKL